MEFDLYLRFLLALIFVLGLIGLLTWLVRRFGLAGRLTPSGGRQRRLEVVEVLALDGKHRLVLLRRDSVEHLVLIGATADLVIEGGISRHEPDGTPP
jgi:flagellar protein FliO/FliZ